MSHLIILGAADCYVMLIRSGGKLRREINPRVQGTSLLVVLIFIRNSYARSYIFSIATHILRS